MDIGLYYFNACLYDQDIGRFISEDPIKDGIYWYTYAASNPLRYVDPSGLGIRDRWNKVVSWFRGPVETEDVLGQLSLETQWQTIYSKDSTSYISDFQRAAGIEVTGRVNEETNRLLELYG